MCVAGCALGTREAAGPAPVQEVRLPPAKEVAAVLGERLLDGTADREARLFAAARLPALPPHADRAGWESDAAALRAALQERVTAFGEAADWPAAPVRVEWLDSIEGGPGYRIRKVRFEALPGMWIPGLLYLPEDLPAAAPAILHLNGHDSLGKAAPHVQIRAINLAKRGVIGLSIDWFWTGQLDAAGFHHDRLNQLDLAGASGIAPFMLLLARAVDLLASLPVVDADRIGATGLSGGGWQTLWLGALDERVALMNPVAGYEGLAGRIEVANDLGDSEQLPADFATVADYTHLTALMAPRATLLTYNAADDCCFEAGHALGPLVEAAAPVYALYGAPGALRTHVSFEPGTHNFERDNREQLYRLVGETFFADSEHWDSTETPYESELKTEEDLAVDLPEENIDLHQLAVAVAGRAGAVAPSVERVAEIVRAHRWQAIGGPAVIQRWGDLTVQRRALSVGGAWTVPSVELAPPAWRGAALLLADDGRAAMADRALDQLAGGRRAVAIDPFAMGELAPGSPAIPLLLQTVGERPLGVEASQVAAAARLLAAEDGVPVALVAAGRRASAVALVAAALEPDAIAQVELSGALGSLKELIDADVPFPDAPDLFCPRMLPEADLPALERLIAPRPVRHNPQ
jgi:dienelactone hydrolase